MSFLLGPYFIKWGLKKYSGGQIIASNVSLTPLLDINIGSLNYQFHEPRNSETISGFSRGLSLTWSIFSQAPFVSIKSGPTFIQNFGEVKSIEINFPKFIDFELSAPFISVGLDELTLLSGISAQK